MTRNLTVKINLDNDAFFGNENQEAARILRNLAKRLEDGDGDSFILHDINGNKVGEAFII